MSAYRPYKSFDNWKIDAHREHGEVFLERATLILNGLKDHEGDGLKFKAAFIADKIRAHGTKCSPNQAQAAIRHLRSMGHPICSDGDGFWYSTQREDILNTLNHLQDRAYAIQYAMTKLAEHLK